MRHRTKIIFILFALVVVLAMVVGNGKAQQVPIPTTAAEVPGPAAGIIDQAEKAG